MVQNDQSSTFNSMNPKIDSLLTIMAQIDQLVVAIQAKEDKLCSEMSLPPPLNYLVHTSFLVSVPPSSTFGIPVQPHSGPFLTIGASMP